MHKVYYPISGSNAVAATGAIAVRGIDLFNIGLFGSGTAGAPATGTIFLQTALTPNYPYLTVYSNSFNGATNMSGIYFTMSGPIESINAISSGSNGTYSVVVAAKYNAQI